MRAIKSVQKSLATEFYGACSSARNKVARCKRFDVIEPERLLVFLRLWSPNVNNFLNFMHGGGP